jgi:PKD repeat protein
MWATSVVAYSGWYLDDVEISGTGGGPGPSGYGGAVGIMDQGATWNVDILRNEVYDVHSAGWAYGIEVTPTALEPVTKHFQAYLDFQEDFTGLTTGAIPTGWTKDPTTTNWGAYPSSYAGGVSPEMRFYYSPSSTDDFYLMTPEIDTSDFTTLDLSFSHYINHYTTPYTLKVVTLAGGNEYEIDSWQPTASGGPFYESYTLTASEGVGASDFQVAWVFSGYSWNINYWYFDDVVLFGAYDYYETVYPWPLDVNIEENHIYRINLGDGYPCNDDPAYPGVMLTVNYADIPGRVITPADASQVVAFHNWFDMDCFYPALAILNTDLSHCLMATNNYYSAPDGPGSFDPMAGGALVYDCITGEPADGLGSQIVLYGPVAFDKWLGLNAVAMINGLFDDVIYAEVGEAVLLDGSLSWAKDFTGVFEPTFFWNKGDGYLSMEKMIAHVYTAPGTYHGYLRVHMLGIPEFGIPPLYEWDYFTVIVTSPGAPLSANAGGGSLGQYETSTGEKITLQGTASGGTQPYTYSWDLGDGRIVQGQNPTVTFWVDEEDPVTTEHTVTLTVIDANYDVATDTATVTVLAPGELDISINAPVNAASGEYVTFQSEVTGGTTPYSYIWNFGDGITSTQKTPVHIYENAGTYTVTLTITDGLEQEKTATHTIEVETGSTSEDPQIKSVKGIFGIKATIAAGDSDCDWTINVDGKYVLSGGQETGTIPANMEQTVKLPLTLAFGKVTVTVTANTIQKQYTAFALGPFFLSLQEA